MSSMKQTWRKIDINNIDLNIEQKNGVITANFEEIKQYLGQEMEEYRRMVFTEDTKPEAKKKVAYLRKLKKAISDRRIEVKKGFMQPYTEFEQKVKELDNLIDEPINFINQQVTEFECKRVRERKEEINAIYKENIDGMDDYLPLQSIYNQKWENTTTSKKTIKEEIAKRVEEVKQDLEVIKGMQTEAVNNALDFYRRTLSLADTIQYVNQWEKQKAEILRKQEEKKKEEISTEKEQEPVMNPPVPEAEDHIRAPEALPVAGEKQDVMFAVTADIIQLAQLESAMKEFGIKYRRV